LENNFKGGGRGQEKGDQVTESNERKVREIQVTDANETRWGGDCLLEKLGLMLEREGSVREKKRYDTKQFEKGIVVCMGKLIKMQAEKKNVLDQGSRDERQTQFKVET